MSRVDEVRAELGEDNVNELMDAYYTSGLSLKDLRELYDLPKSFTDEKIVELFPSIEIEEDCPFCGYTLVAPRLSRGIRGVMKNSYREVDIKCPHCNKSRRQIDREIGDDITRHEIRKAFSRQACEFDWEAYDPNDFDHVALEVLVENRDTGNHTLLAPIYTKPLLYGFFDLCKSLRQRGYIEPSAAYDKWMDGFEETEDGHFIFYWLRVPYSISLKGYRPLEPKPIIVKGDREYVELGQGEREYWLRTAKGLVLAYLDAQLDDACYDYEGPKREEFETLLDTMLLEYSPAQITSLIWNAMATAEKHAEEGPAFKRTGNWAMGVVLNRAKKALSEHWDLHPNFPSRTVEDTEFEWYFFDVHVPIGETWMYRSIPEVTGGCAEIKHAKIPKGVDAATAAMIAKARKIARRIGTDELDYLSYNETERFIKRHE